MATRKKAPGTTKKPARKRAPRKTSQKFYRNLRAIPVSFRLSESDRRIELAPRGQRGDVRPVVKGDSEDPIYIGNVDLVFEVISKEEADTVMEKQKTNIQQRTHPSLDTIRNERGEEYDKGAVRLATEEESVGKTVAPVDEQGNLIIDRDVGIKRVSPPGAQGSSIPHIPDGVNPEDQAQYLADLRSKTTKDEPTST